MSEALRATALKVKCTTNDRSADIHHASRACVSETSASELVKGGRHSGKGTLTSPHLCFVIEVPQVHFAIRKSWSVLSSSHKQERSISV